MKILPLSLPSRKRALPLAAKIEIAPYPGAPGCFGVRVTSHAGRPGWLMADDGYAWIFDNPDIAEGCLAHVCPDGPVRFTRAAA